jgi:hypothetical protein
MFPAFNLKSYIDWVFYGPTPLHNPPGPPTKPGGSSSPSDSTPYTEASDIVILPDGRTLGYAQYGSPAGKPVVFLHGMPGSRLDAAHFDDIGKDLGARIIGIDRPGIGWSTPQPGRTLLSHAEDVEAVTNHLKIDKFRIMVYSNSLLCHFSLATDQCIGGVWRRSVRTSLRKSFTARETSGRFNHVWSRTT